MISSMVMGQVQFFTSQLKDHDALFSQAGGLHRIVSGVSTVLMELFRINIDSSRAVLANYFILSFLCNEGLITLGTKLTEVDRAILRVREYIVEFLQQMANPDLGAMDFGF